MTHDVSDEGRFVASPSDGQLASQHRRFRCEGVEISQCVLRRASLTFEYALKSPCSLRL